MWGKAAQVFEQRVVIYFYCIVALYDEFDTVLIQFFKDGEDFKSAAAYAVKVGH